MKKVLLTAIVVFFAAVNCFAANIKIYEPQIPILVDAQDNVLLQIRIEANENEHFSGLRLAFSKLADIKNIKSLTLYYGGTETIDRSNKEFFAPVQYIPRDNPLYRGKAVASYSIKLAEIQNVCNKEVDFVCNHPLVKGVNYAWISIQMKRETPLLAKLQTEVKEVSINGESVKFESKQSKLIRRMGIAVRAAGDDGVSAYRIPGLETGTDGTLYAIYDIRHNSSVDLQEYVEVGLSRSLDGGETWLPMQTVFSFGEYDGLPKAQNGVGDPAILVDKNTGTVWAVALWTHGMGHGRGWVNSKQGLEVVETGQMVLSKSEDHGKTWSAPINITKQIKNPEWHLMLQGPGKGITMQDGTLVFAAQYIAKNRIPNSGIIYSKDHGKTWKMHQYARTNTTEAQVVELTPGELMLNMRDNRGGSRAIYTTKDMGRTWKEHESSRTELIESVCMASLINSSAKENVLGEDILLFSNPNTTEGRYNITIKLSRDGGKSFPQDNWLLIDEGHGWGYSCLTMVDKETVGILYESSVGHMVFQKIKLEDFINTNK